MINYKELKVEHPRRYFSSNVVNEIDTVLDGIEHALGTDNVEEIQDKIDTIRCLLYDYDEPLMNELNDLRAKNDSLEIEVNYQKDRFDKATKVIGLLALEAYGDMEKEEK